MTKNTLLVVITILILLVFYTYNKLEKKEQNLGT